MGLRSLFLVILLAGPAAGLSEVICAGDCNYDGTAAVNELVSGVNIALERTGIGSCTGFDLSGDGKVAVNELVAGVGNALGGCPVARLVHYPCDIPLPDTQDPDGVDCGDAIVREDRSRNDGRTVRIPFAVFRALGEHPAPDPLLHLHGGPGGGALQFAKSIVGDRLAPFRAERDLILFNQRGNALALPSLDCPEWRQALSTYLARYQTIEEDAADWVAALRACHDRLLNDDVNLTAYTSSASAHDAQELMLALGYRTWNIDGLSYGTRLGQTILRDAPDRIRSILLDSNVPVEVHQPANLGQDLERSLDTLFAGCAADSACNAAFPDLAGTFFDVVAALNDQPVTVHPANPRTGERFTVVITGDRLLLGMQQALYDTDLIPLLPLAIKATSEGDYALLTAGFGPIAAVSESTYSWGQYFSVQCYEEMPFVTPATLTAAHDGVRDEIRHFSLDFWNRYHLDICAFWESATPPVLENEPVSSDVPALVLAGEYDPITPPAYSRLVVDNLSHGTFAEFRGIGHGVLGDSACASEIFGQFLADPTRALDTSCVDALPPPHFVVP